MRNWTQVQQFIHLHSLPYTIIRFSDGKTAKMIDTFSGKTVAENVEAAEKHLKGF